MSQFVLILFVPFLFITINYIDLINISFLSNVVEELSKLATVTLECVKTSKFINKIII